MKKGLIITIVLICVFLFCGSASAANNWTNQTVAKGNFTNISGALNSYGDPSICYYDVNNGTLKYIYKSNGTWNTETIAKGNFGQNSLAIDKNNNPNISYYDITNNDLDYAYKSNGTWTTEIIGNGGYYNSIVIDSNNNPCISYSDENNYIEYANLTNGTWNTTELYYGTINSLAVDSNNNPNVLFYDGNYLWYQYFSDGAWDYSYVGSYKNLTATALVMNSNNTPYISFINNGFLNFGYENNGTWVLQNTTALNVTYDSLAMDSNGNLVSTFDVNNGSSVNFMYTYQNYNYDAPVWYCNIIDNSTTPTTFQSIVKLNSTNDPSIIYYNSNTGQLEYTSSKKTNTSPSDYYDLRSTGKLPPVENQGKAGDCWTFATLASLESCLLPNTTAYFSENNLKDLSGFDIGWNDGGFYEMSTAYLASWRGPVNATDDPYNDTSGVSPTNLTTTAHVQNVLVLPVRTGPLDNSYIKSALTTYGAVATYMEMDDAYMDKSTYGYYYNGTPSYDHAVTIVGWDDNYSRYNFNIVPQGDGAFIVRNSWGTSWADGGYFYVSYYDTSLGTESSNRFSSDNFVFIGTESVNNYNKIYQYDPLGWTDSISYGQNTSWMANIFKSTGNDQLAAASFYIPAMNSSYTLSIYTNVTSGKPTSGTLVNSQSGTLNMGYWTIKLNQLTQLTTNTLFSIVLKLTTPGVLANILIQDQKANYSSNATSVPGVSFCSNTGVSWYDLNNMNATACIKAFTILPPLTVSNVDPLNNSIINIGNKSITITFNEPIEAGITYDNITVTGSSGTITITKTINGNLLTLTANSNYLDGNYTINLPINAITNLMGNGLASLFTSNFTVDTVPPTVTADPVGGIYNNSKSVTLTTTDLETTTTYYTTDGSDPQTSNTRVQYTNPIVLKNTTTLRYIAVDGANNWSPEYSQTYTIVPVPVANFTVNATSGFAPQTVQFNDNSSNSPTSWLWDFGDGSTSTLQNPTHTYTKSGTYTVTLTVTNLGGTSSITQTSYINVFNSTQPNVTTTTDEGIYKQNQTVILTTDQPGSNIYYTTDGSDPTDTKNTKRVPYNAPIPINNSTVLNFAAVNNGGIWSSRYTKTYIIDTSIPTASATPNSGIYSSAQTVTISGSDADTKAIVYYTTDGSDPQTSGTATIYTNPITIDTTKMLRYIAVDQAGNWGTENNQTYTILPVPIANFTASKTTGTSTLNVQFNDTSSNNPTNWLWVFGDGSTSTLQNPTHTYNKPGTYTVTLTATNLSGNSTITLTNLITINYPAPVANFTTNMGSGTAPINVQFTDNSTGNITGYNWNFGDGSQNSTLQNTTHNYVLGGVYAVTETVTGPGGSSSITFDVTITPDISTPVASASLDSGLFNKNQIITLSAMDNDPNLKIYYTLNGTNPTTSSTPYSPISISKGTTTLKFIAVDTAGNISDIVTRIYTIDTTAPTASTNLITGLYNTTKTVTISMSKNGTIYYTLNGATPTTTSTKYIGPITIKSTTTLKYLAVDLAGNNSGVYTSTYTIDKTAPKIISTTPTNLKTSVSRVSTTSIKFSENIKTSTYFNTITIKNLKTGKTVTSTKSISGNILSIKTTTKTANTWYLVTIPKSAIKDIAGNTLTTAYTFKFRTGN